VAAVSATARARSASLVLLSALLAGTCALARADGSPPVGGPVPSTLALSLGEPSGFRRTGSIDGENVYAATVRAEVTATDTPARLSVVGGPGARVARPLRSWSEPVSLATAKVHLRQVAPSAGALQDRDKILLVTLAAGGP
jgi:hypothetical protein